jgi:prepilin-type processing-associated H-X9-DG protein
MTAPAASFYVTGGNLPLNAPSYVERQADRDLYEGLTRGEYCYVLHARQMGKSSLMVRTTTRLRSEGAAVAAFELTALGQNLTAEQWYDGLLSRIGRELDLEEELEEYWLEHERQSPLQRWLGALEHVVLSREPGRIVIFLDEIDAVRSLPFSTDEFFAALLFPVFAHVRETARQSTCLSNLKQLALGHQVYVQSYDETLPPSHYPVESVYWTEFLRPYYGDPRLLDQGFMSSRQREETHWMADYALCGWGPGGLGTLAQPYYRWPGAFAVNGSYLRPMHLAEVRRPAEVLQFADGLTSGSELRVLSRHDNGTLNGAFVDGHVGRVSQAAYNRIGQDERGYYWVIAAADR